MSCTKIASYLPNDNEVVLVLSGWGKVSRTNAIQHPVPYLSSLFLCLRTSPSNCPSRLHPQIPYYSSQHLYSRTWVLTAHRWRAASEVPAEVRADSDQVPALEAEVEVRLASMGPGQVLPTDPALPALPLVLEVEIVVEVEVFQ